MDITKWLGLGLSVVLLTGCGGGGGDDSEVASPIDGDRIKKEDINDFLDQKSSATSIELQQTYKKEFPTQYETDYSPKIDTVLVGVAEGGGFSNDIVFGVSAIFPEDYVLWNGPCDGAIQLYLDTDMNADTGYAIDDIGVDFIVVGNGYLLDDSGVYYYDSSSDNFVSNEFPGGSSLWQPRFSQGNNGYVSSCIDGDTPGNITIKRMVSVYSSSDLLNTESRGIIRIDRVNRLQTNAFHIPALTQTDSDSNSDDNTFNLTGTHSYKGYYQECESDKAEGTIEFDASYYSAEGEDWHSDCELTSFTDSGSHTLDNIVAVTSSEFDLFLRGWYPQDTFQIEYLTFNESGIKAKITDLRDDSVELFEIGLPINNSAPLIDSSNVSQGKFNVTSNFYGEADSSDLGCQSEFGENYKLADWNDVIEYYNSGESMDDFFNLVDMPGNGDEGARSLQVARDGSELYSTTRHYFITRHDHNKPGYYLSHANIDEHLIDLGSWNGERPALCFTKSILL